MPSTRITGSQLEEKVANWLDDNGFKGQYERQIALAGGRAEKGGAVIDFLLPSYNLVLRVMGEYFHRGLDINAQDLIQKQHLEAMGLRVVDIRSLIS